MSVIWRRLARLTRREDGFTMVATVGILFTVGLLSIAAFAAADGDFKLGAEDKERKGAYAAAEAGVNDYLARLIADTDYWRKCADPEHPGLNLKDPSPAARKWATIDGSTAQYSIEVLPANGSANCNPANAQNTYIDTTTGTFRIRATGRSSATSPERRSIISTFRRRGFLDYIWFTDFETQNPEFYVKNVRYQVNRENPRPDPLNERNIVEWAREECGVYYRDGRADNRFVGDDGNSGRWETAGTDHWEDVDVGCSDINFVTGDQLRGPMHSNDEFLLCGSPIFGRGLTDDIEVSGPRPKDPNIPGDDPGEGYRQGCGGAPQVNFPDDADMDDTLGIWRKNAPLMTLPPSNNSLKEEALPNYRFKGATTITLSGNTMTVVGKRLNGNPINAVMNVPTDGVVYVYNDDDPNFGPCTGYLPQTPTANSQNCGDIRLSGSYSRNLTIGAENDILVTANVTMTPGSDTLLGLISNNFIRVHHPTSGCSYSTGSGSNSGSPTNIRIDAAILSVTDSFTVDHWWCGTTLGTLTVNGAIAQKFRGTVGTGSGSSGYLKNYNYDERLRFRSPPHFLDPVQTGWRILNYVEQVPPAQ